MSFCKTILPLSAALISLSIAAMPTFAQPDKSLVNLKLLTPRSGDLSGVKSRAFIVTLSARFKGNLASTGVSPELTGPDFHSNTPPFPGSFGLGTNDHFPGLVVLLSSTKVGAGAGQNLSNLFNVTSVTSQTKNATTISSTWIAGTANIFGTPGQITSSRLFVAIVKGKAPATVQDLDKNGIFNEKDLERMGFKVISNVQKVNFFVNGF